MKKLIIYVFVLFNFSCGPAAKETATNEAETVADSTKFVDYQLSEEEIAAGYKLVTEEESATYNPYCSSSCSGSPCIPGGKRCTCRTQDGNCRIVACRSDSSCPG